MSTTTTNYGLIKPDTTDPILIGQLNDNSDAIDAALKDNVDAIESKQDALTAAQLAAVNSGIDSTKVEQIETNKNNILYNTKNGVSNVLPLNTVYVRGVHADVTNPSKIHFYGTPNSSGTLSGLTKRITLKEGTYTIIVNTDFDTSLNTDIYLYDITTSDTILTIKTSGTYEFTANPTHEYLYAFYFNQGVTVDFNYQVTVRPKNSPDVGFQPYAMSNSELTEKEQANENNIMLNRHYGVKNIFIPTAGNLSNPSGFTGTITRNADNSYTINGSTGGDVYYLQLGRITMPVGTFVLYARPSNKTGIFVYNDGDWADNDNSRYKTFSQPTSQGIFLRIAANQTLENYTIYPMICDLTAWNMSRDYERGALSNAELTAAIQALQAQLANQ